MTSVVHTNTQDANMEWHEFGVSCPDRGLQSNPPSKTTDRYDVEDLAARAFISVSEHFGR